MSLLGTILRPKKASSVRKIATCSRNHKYSYRAQCRVEIQAPRGTHGDSKSGSARCRAEDKVKSVEDIFVRCLAEASSCRRGAGPLRVSSAVSHGVRQHWSQVPAQQGQRRRFTSTTGYGQEAALAELPEGSSADVPRERYQELADTYISPSEMWEPSKWPAPAMVLGTPKHFPLAPRLVITPEQELLPPFSSRKIPHPVNRTHNKELRKFQRLLFRTRPGSRQKQVWGDFWALHSPRVRYMEDWLIRRLFKHLAWVETKSLESSQRYFALLDECLAERVGLVQSEWNTAISFAGRWLKYTTSEEVRSAVETWMRMERNGAQADHVTFNILFDVAARAGRFALADTIFNELKTRKMPLNRYFRTSMIYYAGLRGRGDSVRQGFRELVDAGDIVDTAVMNCVILSLIRAGEIASAEHVFTKMKELHETKFGVVGPRDWQGRKELGIALNKMSWRLWRNKLKHEASFFGSQLAADEQREKAQKEAPIHPDARTCQILIKYHALKSGNLERVRELMQETRDGGWNVQDGVYAVIFRGFWIHGGHAHTVWNRDSLEAFWDEFLQATTAVPEANLAKDDSNFEDPDDDDDLVAGEEEEVSIQDRPPDFSAQIAIRVVHAFFKCAGRQKMLEIWAQVQERWEDMTASDKEKVQEVVTRLVRYDSQYVA